MYPLPDYVMDAFESADVLALEIKEMDTDDWMLAQKLGKLPEGTTITDYISEDTYKAALQILQENNAYDVTAEGCKPVVWCDTINSLMIEKSSVKSELGVDNYLMRRASLTNKTVEGIETVEYHYRVLSDLSMETQAKLLEQAVRDYRDAGSAGVLRAQCKAWAAGNAAAWKGASVENQLSNVPESEFPLMQEYLKAMLTDRDLLMTQYVKNALASGKTVFVCVGISHVVPKGAMVDQLTEAGYTVERVTD